MAFKNKSADVLKIVLVALMLLGAMAAPAFAASGDVEVNAEDSNGNYEGDVTLYDSNDNVITTVTADAGEALFEDVEHGDYYLEAQDSSGATVASETFTHEADTTIADYNISSNSLTVDEENSAVDYVAPTPDNAADFVENPTLGVFLGMVIIGAVFLGILGISGFVLVAIGSRVL